MRPWVKLRTQRSNAAITAAGGSGSVVAAAQASGTVWNQA